MSVNVSQKPHPKSVTAEHGLATFLLADGTTLRAPMKAFALYVMARDAKQEWFTVVPRRTSEDQWLTVKVADVRLAIAKGGLSEEGLAHIEAEVAAARAELEAKVTATTSTASQS
jgi:hypothetical protein